MGPMIDDEIMPVFLINGFLEAGKTEFLSFTMEQEYFQTEGKTLCRSPGAKILWIGRRHGFYQ